MDRSRVACTGGSVEGMCEERRSGEEEGTWKNERGLAGRRGGGSWFVRVRFYVPADVRQLIYDSLAHSEARNFRFIPLLSSVRSRTMILLSTCLGERPPRKQRENGERCRGGEKNDDFSGVVESSECLYQTSRRTRYSRIPTPRIGKR